MVRYLLYNIPGIPVPGTGYIEVFRYNRRIARRLHSRGYRENRLGKIVPGVVSVRLVWKNRRRCYFFASCLVPTGIW